MRKLGSLGMSWRRVLLPGPRLDPSSGIAPLEDSLSDDSYVLVISDRNTRGLGGPIRADIRVPPGSIADFVQFLRNVGEPSDHEHGGGTYGYGKGILYGVSRSHSILVDSFTVDGLGVPRRLMGSAIGHSFYDDQTRFTGRHWWGVDDGEVVNPLSGREADLVAQSLGLPGFRVGEHGTDIAIIGFDLGSTGTEGDEVPRTPAQAAEFLASAILWHLWPKMGSGVREPDMSFEVLLDGVSVPVRRPSDTPELQPFVEALDKIHVGDGRTYSRTRPPKDAGSLAVVDCASNPSSRANPEPAISSAMPFDAPYHHVARIRVPELVVDYFPGPLPEHPDLGYAGVFKSSIAADAIFARSEPPTHDDWVDQGLTGSSLGVVRNSRSFIKSQLSERLSGAADGSHEQLSGLGSLSNSLASIIPSTPGLGAGPVGHGRNNANGSGRRGGRKRVRIIDAPSVRIISGTPYVVGRIHVPGSQTPTEIQAIPFVAIDGGSPEGEPPLGGDVPKVIGWVMENDSERISGAELTVPPGSETNWFLYLEFVSDVAVGLELKVAEQ